MLDLLPIAALTLKKSVTLLALVEPASMIPIFLATAEGLEKDEKIRFAATIGLSVTVTLLLAAFLGMPLFSLLGVSIGAMQVGGGIIVLLLAIAMVLGKETTFKGAPDTAYLAKRRPSIVPLVIPLLAGPAALSYVMANSRIKATPDLIHILLPILIIGVTCWLTFHAAVKARTMIRQSTLDVIERIAGFVLAAMAIEMIATGLRELFPVLIPPAL